MIQYNKIVLNNLISMQVNLFLTSVKFELCKIINVRNKSFLNPNFNSVFLPLVRLWENNYKNNYPCFYTLPKNKDNYYCFPLPSHNLNTMPKTYNHLIILVDKLSQDIPNGHE